MKVNSADNVILEDSPAVNGVRPSADVLFQSVAEVFKGSNVLAVILTGMGRDGEQGLKALKACCNCYCIAQSEKTCVVYGMPKAAVESGLCDQILDLDDIAGRLHDICAKRD
jgi:two-component system chemotaxis response regulator CheB